MLKYQSFLEEMKKYRINKGFIVQKLGKKTVIFDGEKSVLYTFNETASFIFKKMKLNWTIDKIAEEMTNKYNISFKNALKDAEDLLSDLIDKKIVLSLKK